MSGQDDYGELPVFDVGGVRDHMVGKSQGICRDSLGPSIVLKHSDKKGFGEKHAPSSLCYFTANVGWHPMAQRINPSLWRMAPGELASGPCPPLQESSPFLGLEERGGGRFIIKPRKPRPLELN